MDKIEINIPAEASEVTLKTAGKYCDKDIRVTSHGRVIKGTYKPSANESTVTISDIPSNAKTVEIRAVSTVTEGTAKAAPVTLAVFRAIPADGHLPDKAENMWVEYHAFGMWASSTIHATNDAGLSFTMDAPLVFEGGQTYEWTAYYWDEKEE